MVMLGIVTVGVVRGVPKMFRPPICRAHCAVIFAIAQLSCLDMPQHIYGQVIESKRTNFFDVVSESHCQTQEY